MNLEDSHTNTKWDVDDCMRAYGLEPIDSYKDRAIDYVDPAPPAVKIQLPFVEFFERIKRVRADKWQVHFCNHLQSVLENRHIKGSFDETHAEPQIGKTSILSQAWPAYCYGHDPFWRVVLAMYNTTRSETHSDVVIQIMRSQLYREIFPNTDSHLPKVLSKEGWSTNARLDADRGRLDGQKSFSAVGLQSGITGSSADVYIIDDPYKDPREAFSEQVRKNLELFWKMGIEPRLNPFSSIQAMFHRYSYDDFGGYLLDTGLFNYVRYASIADGDYLHEETGQRFPDPLGRDEGEYISERRGPAYYAEKKKDPRVWNSMFQGRPSSQEGDFFKVGLMQKIERAEVEAERAKCVLWVRAWDNAATEGAGDHTSGTLIGMQPDGTVFIDDLVLKQYSSEKVSQLRKETAQRDGTQVAVCVPLERAQAGKALVFHTEQELQGYTVVTRDVVNNTPGSDAKKRRAWNFSIAVNSGKVKYASDDHLEPDDKWNDTLLRCMRNFGFSNFDDPIDSTSDGYNWLYEQISRGLVMRSFTPQRNLLPRSLFAGVYGNRLPTTWRTYIGVKVTNEENRPNSAIIVARAPVATGLNETLFVLAEYKKFTAEFSHLFTWIDETLSQLCTDREAAIVALHGESESYAAVIRQKLGVQVSIFDEDPMSGIAEANWYMQPRLGTSRFGGYATGLFAVVADEQLTVATDSNGLYHFRQEQATWGFNANGEPTGIGAVLDCLRMTTWNFRTLATPLSLAEEREKILPAHLRFEAMEQRQVFTPPDTIERELQTREGLLAVADMLRRKGEEQENSTGHFTL